MAPSLVHLPNGQTLTVSPVFAGLSFKSNDLNVHQSIFPPGWTIILESQDVEDGDESPLDEREQLFGSRKHPPRRYRTPTLHNDNLFISSISNPSNTDFKPATSPTRQIAMMLWATLYWYFHQVFLLGILKDVCTDVRYKPPPNPHLTTEASSKTPEEGKPKGQWRVNIKREGIFKGKQLFPKLERMGLIVTEDSCVGANADERNGEGYTKMFVTQRSFWQLDPRIFLFTLSPTQLSPFSGASPYPSRPGSPNREGSGLPSPRQADFNIGELPQGLSSRPHSPGPFASSSHLPTYYPPAPPLYTFTQNIRHPIRPKPPAQGQTIYTRFVPSLGQYLSFRTASMSSKSPTYRGPTSGGAGGAPNFLPPNSGVLSSTLPSLGNLQLHPCDTDLLHIWMNQPRVSAAWGVSGPLSTQEEFLKNGLNDKHSFPVIGCWDGIPFGYFEIYWVKEDQLGRHMTGSDVNDWDRGLHLLVGEQEFRGQHRVKVWMSALVHYCWLADPRTQRVLLEPRIDNKK